MKTDNDIVDNTLNVLGDSIGAFDNTLGEVPIYKSGHKLGGLISRFIDRLVDSSPVIDQKE